MAPHRRRIALLPSLPPANGIHLLGVFSIPNPSRDAVIHRPSRHCQQYDSNRHPRENKELVALVRIDANIIAVFVDEIDGFDLHNRND